jgi:hypothetical protein
MGRLSTKDDLVVWGRGERWGSFGCYYVYCVEPQPRQRRVILIKDPLTQRALPTERAEPPSRMDLAGKSHFTSQDICCDARTLLARVLQDDMRVWWLICFTAVCFA